MEGRGRSRICNHPACLLTLSSFGRSSTVLLTLKITIAAAFGRWSACNAEFLHNEVPGGNVTPEILERMRVASEKGKDEAREEGIKIARESLLEVRDVIAGRRSRPVREREIRPAGFRRFDEFMPPVRRSLGSRTGRSAEALADHFAVPPRHRRANVLLITGATNRFGPFSTPGDHGHLVRSR